MVVRIGPRGRTPHRMYIKEWRKKRGLTQEQLAERVDGTKATISRLESGTTQYNAGTLHALAYALNCEVVDLYRDPDRPTADELLRNASPDDRRRAMAVLESLMRTGTDE